MHFIPPGLAQDFTLKGVGISITCKHQLKSTKVGKKITLMIKNKKDKTSLFFFWGGGRINCMCPPKCSVTQEQSWAHEVEGGYKMLVTKYYYQLPEDCVIDHRWNHWSTMHQYILGYISWNTSAKANYLMERNWNRNIVSVFTENVDFGLWFSADLKWNTHIQSSCHILFFTSVRLNQKGILVPYISWDFSIHTFENHLCDLVEVVLLSTLFQRCNIKSHYSRNITNFNQNNYTQETTPLSIPNI